MKRLILFLIVLTSMIGLYAQAENFLSLRSEQITTEVIERIENQNRHVRGPSFDFATSPYNLPDAADISDPATGRFKEDIPWVKDFSRHVNNPDDAELYFYFSEPEHFIITQPDPLNPLKLKFQPIPANWNGSELLVITVSDEPLERSTRALSTAIVRINVDPVPDSPVFYNLPAGNRFYVLENEVLFVNFDEYVRCIDSAPLDFDLYVTQTQLTLPYNIEVEQLNPSTNLVQANGHMVMFAPRPYWPPSGVNGTVRFVITAVDKNSNAFTPMDIYVEVLPINDAPEIVSYFPLEHEITIDQYDTLDFGVDVIDLDNDVLTHRWILSGPPHNPIFSTISTSMAASYHFDVPGTYILDYQVMDSQYSDAMQWTIHVQPVGPLFEPVGGVYNSSVTVTLTAPLGFEAATIYYTMDGSIPVPGEAGTFVYEQPIELNALENIENLKTILAIYILDGYPVSQVVSHSYRITGQVASLMFNPVGGTYYSATQVSITSANAGATIHYTIDGSDPVVGGSNTFVYTGPISIASNTSLVIKAIGVRADWISSPIRTESYNITGVVTIVSHTMNPPVPAEGDHYEVDLDDPLLLKIQGINIIPPSASLYYTLDGSIPNPDNPSSFIYIPGADIELTCPTWINLRAFNEDWLPSTTISYYYDVRTRTKLLPFANGTVFDPLPGIYTQGQLVSLSTDTYPAGAYIYYTTDGSDPTDIPSLRYTDPFWIDGSTTVKVMARDPELCCSEIYTGNYVITGQIELPQFSPAPASYAIPEPVSIYSISSGTTIYYTLDGSDPDETDNLYTAPLSLPAGTYTIKARAYKDNWIPSGVRTGVYHFGILPEPIFSHPSGSYNSPISVQITVPVDGAFIYYTTTGGEPSIPYTGEINIGENQSLSISAIAKKTGWADSEIVSRTYNVTGQLAMPSFNPPASFGPFNGSVNVSIVNHAPGSTIKYTTDGEEPSQSVGMIYENPITISNSTTLKAIAIRDGWASSAVNSEEYTIVGDIATPIFTPGSGTYTSAINVFISVNPPDAQIYYTNDGSTPEPVSAIAYTMGTPILVSNTTQLKAIAVKAGWNDSSVGTAEYTITGTVATPIISPASGTYYSAQTIDIVTTTPGASIRYTIDGSEPSQTHGILFEDEFILGAGVKTVRAIAYKDDWEDSPISSANYVIIINPQVSTPTFMPAGAYYSEGQSVSIHAVPADADIYFTTDGSTPDNINGTLYTTPITVNEHTIIRAIAYKDHYPDSDVGSAEYFFRVANPSFSVLSGSFAEAQNLALSVSTTSANIRYTTDGSDPSPIWGEIYDGTAILIDDVSHATVVKAVAYLDGWISSAIVTHTYVINPPVAEPFFSVASGDYYDVFSVSISTIPAVANIYYTTNGSDPSDTNGTLYTAPILINRNITLKAKAYLVNYPASGIKEATYNMHNSPVSFAPPQGTYHSNQLVSLSTSTPSAAIWYTLDGSTPMMGSGMLFDPSNPILVDHDMTIKAFAQRNNWHDSSITSASYVIDIPLPNVAPLSILPASGLYTEAINVVISSSTPGANIRYTTDGTEPTLLNGITYTEPFEVSVNTTVTARAFLDFHNPSEIAVAQYIIVIPIQSVAAPTFNPPAGVYNEPKLVSIFSSTDSASIRYTTDGSEPSETHGMLYTDAINIESSSTIKAIAYKAGMNPSQVVSSAYVIDIIVPTVSAVSFSLSSGTYYLPQSLSLNSSTAGAAIRYTLDGSDPTPTWGIVYDAAIEIPQDSSMFIKAIAYLDGYNPSAVASAHYLVTGTVADVIFSLPSGTYQTAQSLSLNTSTEDASIYYTTDGSNPTRASNRYHQPIVLQLNSSTTIKARAFKTDWLPSDIESNSYDITGSIAFNPPALYPLAGIHNNQITISISEPIPSDALVYYTIDGSTPDESSHLYSAPFILDGDATIQAVAIKAGWTPAYVSASYQFKVAAVQLDPAPGSYPNEIQVSLSTLTSGAQIRYTIDGTEPSDTNGNIYTEPIVVSQNRTIKAYAFLNGYADSELITGVYAIGSGIPMVATPIMNPQSGTYASLTDVSISVSTPGALIYFTTDGSEPTQESDQYLAPITLPMNQVSTIKAKAFKDEWLPSATAVEVYNVTGTVAEVLFDPPAGAYTAAKSVQLSSTTAAAYIRYTLDGSEPDESSSLYIAPIAAPLDASTTIKAKAYKAGWNSSSTTTAVYEITGTVALTSPVFSPAAGNYNAIQLVSISSPIPSDALIKYTTDGSDPSETNGLIYTQPIEIAQTTLLKAIAYKEDWLSSPVMNAQYHLALPAPVFGPAPGLYQNQISVNISSSVEDITIRYTTDGSDPSATHGDIYDEAIVIAEANTIHLKAMSIKDGWQNSPVSQGIYNVTGTVQDVSFSPAGGVYQSPVSVILSTPTPEAVIRYTTDGNDPDATSAIYNTAIIVPLDSAVTIKAKAYRSGWIASAITEESYNVTGTTIISDPVFSIPSGTYATQQQVSINTAIPADASIYYTIDNSDPSPSSTLYSAPIELPLNTVINLKARAYGSQWDPSPIYTAVYNMTGQVQLPTAMFSPAAGTYQTAQSITLAAPTLPTDATLRYTLDGSEPSPSSAAYTSPISLPLNSSTTLKVKGFKDGWTPSATMSASYNITGQLSFNAPVFDPAPGIYNSAQSITINSTVQPGTTIRYTTDGSEPTASSAIYSTPIAIPLDTVQTIKVKAFKNDWTASVTHTAQYTITGQLSIAAPTFTPAAGIYTSAQTVMINDALPSSVAAVIRYTTDGSDPTVSSPIYSSAIDVSSSTQIKVRAYATNWLPSEVYLADYIITGQVEIPEQVFTPPSGTYSSVQMLTFGTPVPSAATIRYTMDESEPDESSAIYTRPIALQLDRDITIKAKAFLNDWIASDTYVASYHMTGMAALSDPVFDPEPGIYTEAQVIQIISSTIPAGGSIRYTTDGSDPDESSSVYEEAIEVELNSILTIKARAYVDDWDAGEIISGTYHVTGQVQLPTAMFSPAAGTYQTAQNITLAAPTLPTDATLRYTLDGSEPSPSSAAYTSPISLPLNSSTTLKIKGFRDGWVASETMRADYLITGTLPAPIFSIAGGLFAKAPVVYISCEVEGATIHYTTDGSDPDSDSPILAADEALDIPAFTQNMVIKARAFKTDWVYSDVSSETYSVMEVPIDLRAFTYGGYIRIIWNLETPLRALQGFNIERRALTESAFTKLNTTPIPLTQKIGNDWYFDDYNIKIDTSYEYRVSAVYDGVESLPSAATMVVYQSQDLQISNASYAYPNPAETHTTIKLLLTRNDNVSTTVSIYDFSGKKIKTINVPATNSNLIEILWDLKNSDNKKVGRGTYFAKIIANDSVNKAEHIIKISVK